MVYKGKLGLYGKEFIVKWTAWNLFDELVKMNRTEQIFYSTSRLQVSELMTLDRT